MTGDPEPMAPSRRYRRAVQRGLGSCCGYDPILGHMDISPRTRAVVLILLAITVVLVGAIIFAVSR